MSRQSIHLKKEVLVRLIRAYYGDSHFTQNVRCIPFDMRPKGADVPFRCCIYKERAILRDRIIAGLGFSVEDDDEMTDLSDYTHKAFERSKPEENPLTVVATACKGCTPKRIFVTDLCQGCVARPCQSTCKFGAINFVNGKFVIDGEKCKNCKMCIPACPYNAIAQIIVPCENACPVNAIHKNHEGFAQIDYSKCISCGKCITSCPFGAVHEKSQIVDVLKNFDKKVIALIAPSIAGQFPGSIYQLKSAMLKAGFSNVYEVAQGADITTRNEAAEFKERMEKGEPFMTTSCCAGYFGFVKKHLPDIKPFVSHTKTPLYYIAKKVKTEHPDAITVFISPCAAKKNEAAANENIDYVLNYEELGALFVAKNIEILDCEDSPYDIESSRQGRNFGVSGGVAKAVASICAAEVKPCIINGLTKETIKQLQKMAKEGNCEAGNLVEIMCCEEGCIGGNATICTVKVSQKALAQLSEQCNDLINF